MRLFLGKSHRQGETLILMRTPAPEKKCRPGPSAWAVTVQGLELSWLWSEAVSSCRTHSCTAFTVPRGRTRTSPCRQAVSVLNSRESFFLEENGEDLDSRLQAESSVVRRQQHHARESPGTLGIPRSPLVPAHSLELGFLPEVAPPGTQCTPRLVWVSTR